MACSENPERRSIYQDLEQRKSLYSTETEENVSLRRYIYFIHFYISIIYIFFLLLGIILQQIHSKPKNLMSDQNH